MKSSIARMIRYPLYRLRGGTTIPIRNPMIKVNGSISGCLWRDSWWVHGPSLKLNPTILGVGKIISDKSWPTFFLSSWYSSRPRHWLPRISNRMAQKEAESMTSRDQGCRGMVDTADVTLARLRSPLIRGVENLGAGRIEHSGLQAELPPLHETRRGSKIWYKRARAREATRRTQHARTQRLFTPIKGYQERIGSRRKQEPSKNTKHGQMKSIKRAENCTGTRTELSCDRWIVKIENCKIKRRSVYFKVDTEIFRILRVIGFYTKIYVKSIFERTQLNDFLKAMLLLWKKLQNA